MGDLALIILNYNSYADCKTCVDRLLSFGGKMHIIVVDNCSLDGSFALLRQEYCGRDVDVLQTQSNRGYSAGNNAGIRYAIDTYGAETVGILNPDVLLPDENFLRTLVGRLYSDERFAVIGASVLDADGDYDPGKSAWDIPTARELWREHCLFVRKKRHSGWDMIGEGLARVECVAGCFFLAKVSCLDAVGFLDENVFLYNEENILGIRCRQNGFMEVLATDLFYRHNHAKIRRDLSFREKIRATHFSYQSRKYLCKTYYRSKGLLMIWLVERLNKIWLAFAYIKHNILKRKHGDGPQT